MKSLAAFNPRWFSLFAVFSLFSLLVFKTGDLDWLGALGFLGFLGFLNGRPAPGMPPTQRLSEKSTRFCDSETQKPLADISSCNVGSRRNSSVSSPGSLTFHLADSFNLVDVETIAQRQVPAQGVISTDTRRRGFQ